MDNNIKRPARRLDLTKIDAAEFTAKLNDFLVGQQEAMAAFTVALAQVVGKERLAEQLRLQVTSFHYAPENRVRDALLNAAWAAIRPPGP
jgi:hypothetical protein